MDFWEKVVKSKSIPAEGLERLRHNAARLTGSAVVQEYHVMIEAGLEYSYLTNGLALVLLGFDYDEPGTLYYNLCEPNMEIGQEDNFNYLLQPLTAVSRILCLCLMSFRSQYRDQEWRNKQSRICPSGSRALMKYLPRSLNRNCDRTHRTRRYILRSGVVRNNIQSLYQPTVSAVIFSLSATCQHPPNTQAVSS
jgi:hypothetical protein